MTRAGLRDLAAAALTAAAAVQAAPKPLAGIRVDITGTVPDVVDPKSPDLPVLYVHVPQERKVSLGRAGPPKFLVIASLLVVARVSQRGSSEATQSQLDALIDQVHATIISDLGLQSAVQQFAEVETTSTVTAAGSSPIGEAKILFHCELFQRYEPPRGEPLTTIDAVVEVGGQSVAEMMLSLRQRLAQS